MKIIQQCSILNRPLACDVSGSYTPDHFTSNPLANHNHPPPDTIHNNMMYGRHAYPFQYTFLHAIQSLACQMQFKWSGITDKIINIK